MDTRQTQWDTESSVKKESVDEAYTEITLNRSLKARSFQNFPQG
jgi:hypothetical protein